MSHSHTAAPQARGLSPHAANLGSPFAGLIASSIASLRESAQAASSGYGQLSGLLTIGRQVPAEEGRFLEAALRKLVAAQDGIVLIEKALTLPVYDDALDLVERNNGDQLQGIAIDPDRRARHVYRPDLVVIDEERRSALILDVKRSLDSYSGTAALEKLAHRMLAASLTLPDLLYREHKRTFIAHTSIAIVDLADSRDSYPSGVFPIGALDRLLGTNGMVEGLSAARNGFRRAVADLIEELAPRSLSQGVCADLRYEHRIAEPGPIGSGASATPVSAKGGPSGSPRPTFGLAGTTAATARG